MEHSKIKRIYKTVVEIIQSFSTVLSVILFFLTLKEMQRERNTAYAPDLVVDSIEMGMVWDERGNLYDDLDKGPYSLQCWDKDGFYYNTEPILQLYNIGLGNAKRITIEWDFGNDLLRFSELLNTCDGICTSIEEPDEYCLNYGFQINGSRDEVTYGIPIENNTVEYLIGSGQQYREIEFPQVYYNLLRETAIIKTDEKNSRYLDAQSIPPIHLLLSYYDIQGVYYSKRISIDITCNLLDGNPNSDGCCIYTLRSSKEEMNVNLPHTYLIKE